MVRLTSGHMRAAATPGHKAVIQLLYAKAWGEAAARAPECDPAVWTLMDNALVVLIRVVPVDAGPEAWAAVAAVMAAAGRLTASLQLNDRALVGLAVGALSVPLVRRQARAFLANWTRRFGYCSAMSAAAISSDVFATIAP